MKLDGFPIVPSPERDVEVIEVEGRNGSLTKFNGYKDISYPIAFNFVEEVRPKMRDVKKWLLGKKKLVLSDDLDYFYKIKNFQVGNTENELEKYGKFEVDFTLDPFQYKKAESVVLSAPGSLFNEGSYYSEPLLKVFGTGDAEITVNGKIFKLNGMADYVSVDCQLEETHRNGVSRNNMMVGNFPVFKVGNNDVSWNAAVSKIEVETRWRYV